MYRYQRKYAFSKEMHFNTNNKLQGFYLLLFDKHLRIFRCKYILVSLHDKKTK